MDRENLEVFLDDMAAYASADEVRDAAARTTGSRPGTKEKALEALAEEVSAIEGEQLIDLLGEILAEVFAENLRHWSDDVLGEALNKDDAIDDLVEFYTDENAGDLRFEGEDDDDVEDDDAPGYRDERYARRFEEEFQFSPTFVKDERRYELYQREAKETILRTLPNAPGPIVLHIATGGGKTLVANEILVRWLDNRGGPIVWLTKDWQLLRQAARDLSRRHRGFRPKIGRIGGNDRALHPLDDTFDREVLYSTLHTFGRRLRRLPRRFRPTLIVWDESHWGEHGKLGRTLLRWRSDRGIPLLGLTATPRLPESEGGTSSFDVAFSRDFAWLVRKDCLARPNPELPVKTGIPWHAERANEYSDFQLDSLRKLGKNDRRNKLIVEHYARSGKYGKTIVFACSIEHADRLADMFSRAPYGIPARSIHSEWYDHANDETLRQFERGDIQVVVNVAKLTHGVDIPDAKTVFLCRPTLSDILFSQMIGRASRRIEGKDSFYIVEFVDNLDRFGDQLCTSQQFFEGCALDVETERHEVQPAAAPRVRRPVPHEFDPRGAPTWIPDFPDVPEALRGLWYRQGQTFGIEIELTRDDFSDTMSRNDWLRTGNALRSTLRPAVLSVASECFPDYGDPKKSHLQWNVERDNSAGWEITSRVLKDREGFEEAARACAALDVAAREFGLKVNYKTGTHVHLGWRSRDAEEIKRAISIVRLFEPALGTLVAPSRIAGFDGARYDLSKPNVYCRPVSAVFPERKLLAARTMESLAELAYSEDGRFVSFNIQRLDDIHTVEVRLHGGTTDASKLLLWISLWQQLLWAASERTDIPVVPDRSVIHPDGDVVALAREFLPAVQQPLFLRRLHQRRCEVADLWRKHDDLRGWLPYADRWQSGVATS